MSRDSRGEGIHSAGRRVQQAWRASQRLWRRLAEVWPFSSLAEFVKSLFLLALWLSIALLIFHYFLPPSLKTPDKETLSLLITLVTALIGFGIQQWKSLAEREERERQQRCQEALDEIAGLGPLVCANPSEGARRYLEMVRRGGIWQSGRVRSHLEAAWRSQSPRLLQDAIELIGYLEDEQAFHQCARRLGDKRSTEALQWALEHLDDEWRQQAFDGLLLLYRHSEYRSYISGQVLEDIEQGPWRAILRPWPHVSLWRGFPLPDPKSPECLKNNPLGSEKAETDALLLTCALDPPWITGLGGPQTDVLVGVRGSGKTATALLLARDCLKEQVAFPVYYPAAPDDLGKVARVLARTLVYYLAVVPTSFLRCGVAGRTAMACLLTRYMCPNLSLHFRLAGLSLSGDGAKVLQEIEALAQTGACQDSFSNEELLTLLGEARPYGFRYTVLLLDVQEQADGDADLQTLLNLSERLARVGIFTKIFLPDVFRGQLRKQKQRPPDWIELQWSEEDLSRLLQRRLARFKQDTLAFWCDPGCPSPDSRLIRAARGTPGGLIRKGNELLQRVGRSQRPLTAQDLKSTGAIGG